MTSPTADGTATPETVTFHLADGKPEVSVQVPQGSMAQARSVLDLIAPLLSPFSPARVYPTGEVWKVPEPVSLAALALLPEATRTALFFEYPAASPASHPHIAHAVHTHCLSAWRDLAASALDRQEGMPSLGITNTAPAAQIANALAFRTLLDAILGSEKHTNERDNLLAGNLLVFERGSYPDTTRIATMDGLTFSLTFHPATDYLAAAEDERERAMAYVLVGVLSDHTGIPREGTAWREEPIDPVTAFARGHLSDPTRYIEAVRLLQTFEPEKLRPMIGDCG